MPEGPEVYRHADFPDGFAPYVSHNVETDADGKYELAGLRPGSYQAGVLGFGKTWIGWAETFANGVPPKTVDGGATEVDFVFPFTGGIVTARVVSKKTGMPIPNFRFSLIRYRGFFPNLEDAGQIRDEAGRFRFELDREGTWAVEFGADGHAPFRTGKKKLKPGEQLDLGTIRLGEGSTLEGRVVDAQGVPVPYARINILSPKMETNETEPFTAVDGTFRVPRVSPGLYMVFAVSPTHPIGLVRNVQLKEGQSTSVVVQFSEPAPLEVTVTSTDGTPLSMAKLYWTFPEIAPLTSKMVGNKIPPGYGDHESDEAGRIVQHALPAGPVTLFVERHGYKPARKSVRLKKGETTRIDIRLAPKR